MNNSKCNICGSKLKEYLNLGNHPCADTFLKKRSTAIEINKYPLKVGYCKCHHLSAVHLISGHERYNKFDYSYTSDNSPVSINHFKNIAFKISKKYMSPKKNKIIEIASNDGTFLSILKKVRKINEIGVDPSSLMTDLAKKKGIKTEKLYFSDKNAKYLLNKYGKFDVIYGANVFNHIDDPYNFLSGCKKLLTDEGVLILEFPDLDQLFKKKSFDTIYHEHRNYYSKNSIIKIFKKINIRILKFEKLEYMSGSLRVYAKNSNFRKFNTKTKTGKQNLKKFHKFKADVFNIKKKLVNFVKMKKIENKTIAGLGAATKGNTLLNFCKLNYKNIKFILETSKLKIGKFTPGSAIPIINERKKPPFDVLIILPWNINKYLKQKIKKWNVEVLSLEDIIKNI